MNSMKYLIFLIFIFIKPAFSVNDLEGRALICSYGKNLTNHEIYLFYKNSYASKYLFLENHNFKIRTNEKRKYYLSENDLTLKPFKINLEHLTVFDMEFNKTIGKCKIVDNHKIADNFMINHKIKSQNKYNNLIRKNSV